MSAGATSRERRRSAARPPPATTHHPPLFHPGTHRSDCRCFIKSGSRCHYIALKSGNRQISKICHLSPKTLSSVFVSCQLSISYIFVSLRSICKVLGNSTHAG